MTLFVLKGSAPFTSNQKPHTSTTVLALFATYSAKKEEERQTALNDASFVSMGIQKALPLIVLQYRIAATHTQVSESLWIDHRNTTDPDD